MSYVSTTADSHIIPGEPHLTASTDPDKVRKERAKDRLRKAEEEGKDFWALTKEKVLQPAVAGGLVGILNLGVIGGLGYLFYTEPQYRSDYRTIGASAAGVLVLLTAEGAYADSVLNTPDGARLRQEAEEEGSHLYRQTREIVLRPGVASGLFGIVNVGILGSLGYLAYSHWNEPVWDRRYVGGLTAGTAALFTLQGYLAEQYREKEYPKRKY
ncbi:SubName: Full=Uncharacterized protein {ECO:0000313/EMBL:CCA72283.1} [Serendipita indica DSM 11827]|uniref:Uncharacterized protein n=1 Tax=Serendipita indica (strain DSM 11827) TaxID=1109443 RepID=G4TLU0_SERID|nr:SubName: Full=Uncharacterized protein {ECO:0000313/EMBL:CCA72283.1} [Serendipita indica DSM 11827]CCA72283.1 hypothetical protein PIIN_06217 [Serendipita indica DSM 11827]